jgi:glutaredoxin-like protein NrdH
VQCTATKRFLDARGLEYTAVDVTEDPDALAFIKGLGYLAAPVVYTEHVDESVILTSNPPKPKVVVQHWSGNQPDRIKAIVK